MSIYIGDKEIKDLYAGGSISVSDMQGPCPDGFHVPLNSEWNDIKNMGISLGAWSSNDGNNFSNFLKLPYAGYRVADTSYPGTNTGGFYWASNRDNNSTQKGGYTMYFRTDAMVDPSTYYSYTYQAKPIRPFKNSPVIPDNTWTELYTGGIYHNSSLGLISISSNGTDWITISDKNLGATTVYSSGDTLSESNCGKYYQRGNNYGFQFSGAISKTSSTRVDASGYGPGNYYENDTFVTPSGQPYTWDLSPYNENLRGGVTQNTEEKSNVKAVYLGDTKVRPSATPNLKSFEEITTMGATAKTELNTYPTEYYAKFSSENHLYYDGSVYYLSSDGTYGQELLVMPKYNPSTSLRQ